MYTPTINIEYVRGEQGQAWLLRLSTGLNSLRDKSALAYVFNPVLSFS